MLLPWAAHRLGDAVDCSLWFQTCTRLFDRISEWTRKAKHSVVAMPLLTGALSAYVSVCVCLPFLCLFGLTRAFAKIKRPLCHAHESNV